MTSERIRRRIRRYLPVWLKKKITDGIYRKVLEHFANDASASKMYSQEISYLKKFGLYAIPYKWIDEYDGIDISVMIDDDSGLKYVAHKGKRLFFPKDMREDEVENAYRALLIEQDSRSPHSYSIEREKFEGIDTFIDLGAAEGILSLDIVDHVDQVVLCECDERWIDALKMTFMPYTDRVKIIKKFAGKGDSDSSASIDGIIKQFGIKSCIVKIDVEGCERDVLDGYSWDRSEVRFVFCCTYHKPNDATAFAKHFSNYGYETSFTDGYILLLEKRVDVIEAPFFRKGVLRAWKG